MSSSTDLGGQPGNAEADPGAGRLPDAAAAVTLAVRNLQRATAEAQLALARRLDLGVNDLAAIDHLIGDEPLGPVELGNRLGIRSASATVLADRLEKAGHVVRVPHPTDRRRQTLRPTDHARTEVFRALAPILEPLQALAATLTADEAGVIVRFLQDAAGILTDYATGHHHVHEDGE